MAHFFSVPPAYLGENALQNAAPALCALGTKALIVTGRSMLRQGHVQTLGALLEQHGVQWETFSAISGEPTDAMIREGAAAYRAAGCDFVIGFGGGSPLDSAKAIALMVCANQPLSSFMGREISLSLPPIAAIPSTAGTGSEVTRFTIITDTATQVKMLLKGQCLMPSLAIVDPAFTLGTPRQVTVSSGLDALTHAVEAYTSRRAFAQTDLFALSAVKRIFSALPRVLQEPQDPVGRTEMALAAYEAGVSFNNSSVTLVHGMSRPIGALFHVPHGLSNAMLLEVCLAYAMPGAPERFADLGRAIGAAAPADPDPAAAQAFLDAVAALCRACAVPTLAEYGIDRDAFFAQINKMSADAMASGSPSNTRRAITQEDIRQLYQKLW